MRTRPQPDNSANNWWERSANSGNSNNFCNVTSGGNADWNNANNANGVAPFGSTSATRDCSESEVKGSIRYTEMQGAVTVADCGQNKRRHAGEAGTHRLNMGGYPVLGFDEVFSFEHLYEAGQA